MQNQSGCGDKLTTVHCCFTSTETVRTVRDGEPRTATTTDFTQLLSSDLNGTVSKHHQWCLTSTETIRFIRDGEKVGVYGGGGRGRLDTYQHCQHQNDSCIKMGSDESCFSVSLIHKNDNYCEGQSHKTVSTNHNPFEEKVEPKRYRTEALLFTSPG